ncbi:MAG: AraC family transcriptional regulator [Acidobacteria bacterium]|nr:AraC family transcriptional regulator [Acidobacteriota bacterium]
MNKRDSLQPKLEPPRGILHHRGVLPAPGYGRFLPSPTLAPFVEHFWTVSWDLGEPEIREVLPHPSIHMVIERGGSAIVGLAQGRFTTRLEGRGRVLGTKFLPGGFRPFLGHSVSRLSGRRIPPQEVFGDGFLPLENQVLAMEDAADALAEIAAFLDSHRPPVDPKTDLARRITQHAATDRSVTRVEQLATEFGLTVRSLQRLFAEYVGISPKWVVQRYRLHEAAERIAHDEVTDWAALALDLGYADQAHFIRDFRRLVGKTPSEYRRGFVEPG